MKADPADQRALLELATCDTELIRLRHQRGHAPEVVALETLSAAVREHRDAAVRAQIAAEDLDREVRRLENEISVLSNRERKDTQLRDSGSLAGKALVEVGHELAGLSRRRTVLEDDLLSVLEQQEATAAEELRCGALVSQAETELDEARVRADAAVADVDARASAATAHRDEVRATVDAGLLGMYDHQVARGRRGAGLLRQARCGACRMEIDRGTLAGYGRAAPDDVVRCEECGAVLVRTVESGL